MTKSQSAALVSARVANLQLRIETMKAANAQRANQGCSPAYDDAAFFALECEFSDVLDYNNLITLFNTAEEG